MAVKDARDRLIVVGSLEDLLYDRLALGYQRPVTEASARGWVPSVPLYRTRRMGLFRCCNNPSSASGTTLASTSRSIPPPSD